MALSLLFISFDARLKIVKKIVIVCSQKASNTPELSIFYIQTVLLFSFSETEIVQLFMKVDVTTTKLFCRSYFVILLFATKLFCGTDSFQFHH